MGRENLSLLPYDAACSGNYLPTFLDNMLVPYLPLKMEPINCPELSVRTYHYTLHNNPKDRNNGKRWSAPLHRHWGSVQAVRSIGGVEVYVKVKCTVVQALRLCTGRTFHKGSRGIALLFLDHGNSKSDRSASRPDRALPRERPGTHCTGGWVGPRAGLDRFGKSRPPPGFDPQTFQPVGSRYTDYATRPTDSVAQLNNYMRHIQTD
jgi:hypothetical protein